MFQYNVIGRVTPSVPTKRSYCQYVPRENHSLRVRSSGVCCGSYGPHFQWRLGVFREYICNTNAEGLVTHPTPSPA